MVSSADVELSRKHDPASLRSFMHASARPYMWRTTMKTRYTVALSMFAGAALGAAAIQGLHAQAKPPVYLIGQIEVSKRRATPRNTRRRRAKSSRPLAVAFSPEAEPAAERHSRRSKESRTRVVSSSSNGTASISSRLGTARRRTRKIGRSATNMRSSVSSRSKACHNNRYWRILYKSEAARRAGLLLYGAAE